MAGSAGPWLQLLPLGLQKLILLLSWSLGGHREQARGVRGVGGAVLPSSRQLESL